MRTIFFSTKPYDRDVFDRVNKGMLDLIYIEARLDAVSADLAKGCDAACIFVNDDCGGAVLRRLYESGVRLVALRSAGFNNVDLAVAKELGIQVVRVPAYSPYAVAEFTVGLLLTLSRRIHRAWLRVREDNFALTGLLGRDLHGKTVGVVGTGRIGALVAKSFKAGFGCEVVACDTRQDEALLGMGVRYVSLDELVKISDVITLHCPLLPETLHMVNAERLSACKPGMILVNTSRGALIDTDALIASLKAGQLGGVAMDVYEHESELFFQDLSDIVVKDDIFQRLLTFPNVLITGHQAFFTQEALNAIAETTISSLVDFSMGRPLVHGLG